MQDKLTTLFERSALAWDIEPVVAQALFAIEHKKSLRVNGLKAKKSTLKEIKSLGVDLKAISWCKNTYKVNKGYEKLSVSQLFTDGYFVMQNSASFVPVLALNAKPGENILDMCAAPGIKTTHIADITNNKARLVANDTSKDRFFKMRKIFITYGAIVESLLADGRFIKNKLNVAKFDKIIIDAPCSGEATINVNIPKTYQSWNIQKIKRLNRLQLQLLISAYELLKPGGTLVYSTCTISPEENEVVINKLLRRTNAKIIPVEINFDLKSMKGITTWKDKQLNPEISKTLRILPSEASEAFFVAKIVKPTHDTPDTDYYTK